MEFNQESVSHSFHSAPEKSKSLFTQENTVVVYTVLSILLRMKHRLGIEAMLEYLEKYLGTIEKHNPRFESAVRQALAVMNVEKMYRDAVQNDQ